MILSIKPFATAQFNNGWSATRSFCRALFTHISIAKKTPPDHTFDTSRRLGGGASYVAGRKSVVLLRLYLIISPISNLAEKHREEVP